jgi:nucleoside 2-deoxyribosyltransferase
MMNNLVYVAGPLFSEAEREFLEKVVDCLAQAANLDPIQNFFLPHRDGGELGKGPTRQFIFNLDINKINSADVIIALLDGQDSDSGTCIELGYAYALNKKIFGILTDFRSYYTNDHEPHRPNVMVWGVCENGNTIHNNINSLSSAFVEYINSKSKFHSSYRDHTLISKEI